MRFLLRLWESCKSFFPSRRLLADDPLARFIFSKSHFNDTKNEVKAAAFMPPKSLELSVSQIKGLDEAKIWRMGNKVGMASGRTLHARADIDVLSVSRVGLSVKADSWPKRHANLIGWPGPDKKQAQMNIANKLALSATLRMPPSEHWLRAEP